MDAKTVVKKINELFDTKNKEVYYNESGITYNARKNVSKIGY